MENQGVSGMSSDDIEWLTQAIRQLPSDAAVDDRTAGYSICTPQKDHWLGRLDPNPGIGTDPRSSAPGRGARYVYNHIVEPKMLLWLATAAGVRH